MSDFSNFRAIYNELTDAVTSAKYQFFKDHLENFLRNIDDTPRAHRVVSDLEKRVDFPTWYAECKETIGSMVGSGTLTWPKDKTDRLAMHIALLRALSNGELDIYDFCAAFLYTANDYDTNVYDISRQLFLPTTRELIRYIEQRFDAADIPASDRTVTINHNSKEYTDADEAMAELEKAIREANDFDDPAEKEQRGAEISAARRLIRSNRVRVDLVVDLIKPTVVQYATKVKDGIVANAANATVTALGVLLGYAFKALLGL
ncbi:hypothetical protein AAFG07_34720 [Bradyrhizobium sp. B097]|uniref:hypothetical protein n=1 Tax=Bradyrhizobium sp. B097 TaxID=3140244 RepID=UPI003183AB5C